MLTDDYIEAPIDTSWAEEWKKSQVLQKKNKNQKRSILSQNVEVFNGKTDY